MSETPSLYYLTTPIYYASDVPHLGHAYTTIIGDALCRYERIRRGDDRVFYLTGTDEHGEKMERAAVARGLPPQAFADEVSQAYRELWQALDIRYDDFIRTTDPRHERVVDALWRTMRDKDDIYRGEYEGPYCVACESFYQESELLPGNLCPDHKRPVERRREEGYFFRLSKYGKALLEHYAAHPDFVEPPNRLNEIRTFVEQGLRDLSVSRSSFTWGVPVPDAPGHVIYVWIDALTNYYSALQEPPARRAFWGTKEHPLAVHLMGKDITRFHAVYWPALLLSAGLPLPKKIVAHGWWTVDGEKMSKSLGNVVDPKALSADIGPSALRYFVLREVPVGPDGDFSYDALITRYNSELCNDLGNLLNRTLGMVEKFSGGVARRRPEGECRLRGVAEAARGEVEAAMAGMQPARALEALFALVREGNAYAEQEAVRRLKTDPVGATHALYDLLEVLRWLALMLEPFIPERAVEIRRQIGLADAERSGWPQTWGELPDGTAVRKGATLFPRIEPDRKKELLDKWRAARRAAQVEGPGEGKSEAAPAQEATQGATRPAVGAHAATPAAQAGPISYEDFKKLDLRAARVVSAERVPKKDRLLKLVLSIGEETRTVVSGIAETVAPDALVGKTVVYLSNLKPAKIGGILSEGMILAAGGEQVLGLLGVDREVPAGTPIR